MRQERSRRRRHRHRLAYPGARDGPSAPCPHRARAQAAGAGGVRARRRPRACAARESGQESAPRAPDDQRLSRALGRRVSLRPRNRGRFVLAGCPLVARERRPGVQVATTKRHGGGCLCLGCAFPFFQYRTFAFENRHKTPREGCKGTARAAPT